MRSTIQVVINELERWQAAPVSEHSTAAVVDVCLTMLRQAIEGRPIPGAPRWPGMTRIPAGVAMLVVPAMGARLTIVAGGHPLARLAIRGYELRDTDGANVYATAEHPRGLILVARQRDCDVRCLYDLGEDER